ncbi:NDR1/HIN1-like protein 6 [Lycium ferocissimum]|uniref:NDR1/HIN1-like protein 6 n=1 Tax=Lycium ferocissimum TaxID=112874 RepID=UPI0028161F39|nr:NDR1/HIN1-like protein 6 [Lycium ferocissimum]
MSQVKPLKKPPGFKDPTIPIQMPPKPRKINVPPPLYPQKKKRRSCCCYCCCCCLIILILLLFLVAACGFLYLWFNPKLPVFHLKSLEFTKFNVTESQDGPKMNAQSTLVVELKNPNRELKIVYGDTRVELKGENDVNMGEGKVSGFVQEKKNVKVVKFVMKTSNEMLYGNSVGKVMSIGFKNKNLRVSADMNTDIGIGYNEWKSWKIGVRVSCGSLRLKQIENGATPKCGITLFNWFHLN